MTVQNSVDLLVFKRKNNNGMHIVKTVRVKRDIVSRARADIITVYLHNLYFHLKNFLSTFMSVTSKSCIKYPQSTQLTLSYKIVGPRTALWIVNFESQLSSFLLRTEIISNLNACRMHIKILRIILLVT